MGYITAKCSPIETSEDNSLPKFMIKGNAGSRMSFAEGDVVINLSGDIKTKHAGAIPILYGHDWDQQIGHASAIEVAEDGVSLTGVVSCQGERASQFVTSSKNGFPWEASLGFMVLDGDTYEEGETVEVNGRIEEGPVTVANSIEIWECSVVLFGADANTASTITAKKEKIMNDEIKNNDIESKPDSMIDAKSNVENNEASIIEAKKHCNVDEAVKNARNLVIAENKRLDSLKAIRDQYGDSTSFEAAVNEGWTPDKYELTVLRASRNNVPGPFKAETNIDKKAVEVEFLRAAGVCDEKKYSSQVLEAADQLRGADVREIIEAATGFQPTTAQRRNPVEYYNAAFTTTDLGSVFVNNANTILLNTLGIYYEHWKQIFKVTSVPDFKNNERWRLGTDFLFQEIGEGDEMKTGKMSDERTYTIKPKSYGIQFNLGYQTLVNGDTLNVFGDTIRQISLGASRRVNKECWKLFLNPHEINVTGTSKAFYHADHENLFTNLTLSLENISKVREAFLKKKVGHVGYNGKDMANKNELLGLIPSILLVPTHLEDKANMLLKATHFGNVRSDSGIGNAASLMPVDVNPQAGRWQVVAVPDLEFASLYGGNAGNASWYMLANPNDLAAFEICFLNGQQSPAIRQADWQLGKLGIQFDGSIHFGVAQGDERPITFVQNSDET